MKKIQLCGSSQVALVDDDDYALVSQYSWKLDDGGYASRFYPRAGREVPKRMHDMVADRGDAFCLDHINGNRVDNRKKNLRPATRTQNSANRRQRSDARSSKYKGVRAANGRFIASIRVDYERVYLGCFKSEDDAGRAYNKAARRLHGPYARLNRVGR